MATVGTHESHETVRLYFPHISLNLAFCFSVPNPDKILSTPSGLPPGPCSKRSFFALCYCINVRFIYYTMRWLRPGCWEKLTKTSWIQ